MTTETSASLDRVIRLVEAIRQIDAELPPQTVLVLLTVARSMPDGILQKELAARLGMGTSATERNVRLLTAYRGPGLPGFGMLQSETVMEDRRQRLIRLTRKGETTVEKLAKALE